MDPPKQGPGVSLEAELTCSICADLLYQPLTLLDCLHTYCGACVKEWFGWQALRAENAPTPPPPDEAVFTCPSCREPVRDTKHDARVTTLLDMFLALHPDKGKSAADKEDMDLKYKKGEKVLPKLSFADRTPEQIRMDDEERRLLAEVQQMSLREAVAGAAAADSQSSSRTRRNRGESRTNIRDPSTEPGRLAGGGGGREREGGRRRAHSATLQPEHEHADEGRRRRSESRQRSDESSEQRRRRVEHQSSLRSLINTDGIDSRDLEKEIEAFARQIQEEGLLDGLDLDNIDLTNNDELSKKITDAYRRRHRERLRHDHHGGRKSNASSRSHRSDISATRPRSRTDDTSRPTSRHSGHSRAPSTSSSNEDRGRYPPSASAHLEVQEPSRRRRTPSASRSATVPVGPTPPDIRIGTRSQSDLSSRASSGERHSARPAMSTVTGGRSTSSPTTVTAPGPLSGSPDLRGLPFSTRAAAGLGISQQPAESSTDQSPAPTRKKQPRPAELVLGTSSSNFSPTSGPLSPGLSSPPLPSPQRSRLPRYKEPFVTCMRCKKEHIEYDLHYNCSTCSNGDWNICLDCWRRGKGCLHWLGFGYTAWARFDKLRADDPTMPPPHMLTANRYLPPKQIPGGAEGRRTLTTDNPALRLQSGTFCCKCAAWTNDCYWRCETCNEGEWGFCNDCVNQGMMCTHPLLPLSYQPPTPTPTPTRTTATLDFETPPSSPHSRSPKGGSPARSPVRPPPPAAAVLTRPNTAAMGNFRPLTFTPPCEICKRAIPPQEARFHCDACPSKQLPQEKGHTRLGGYNLCTGCYSGLVTSGAIAVENGPNGWRRCPLGGHRMVVVRFVIDDRGGERRVIARDYVGGRRLGFEPFEGGNGGGGGIAGMQVCWWWRYYQIGGGVGKGEGGGDNTRKWVKKKMERLVARNVASTSSVPAGTEGRWTESFPPDGGEVPAGTAGWSWYPAEGANDELMFPKGAEILEIQDQNGDWFHGYYMGWGALIPAPYVRFGAGGDGGGRVFAEEV